MKNMIPKPQKNRSHNDKHPEKHNIHKYKQFYQIFSIY